LLRQQRTLDVTIGADTHGTAHNGAVDLRPILNTDFAMGLTAAKDLRILAHMN
jgi:hypothetical protein